MVWTMDGMTALAGGEKPGWRLAAWRFQGMRGDNKKKKTA
jgi:hypothetical protein